MAKAKRERRASIRTMPADDVLQALDALERAEKQAAEQSPAETTAQPEAAEEPVAGDR